MRGPRKGLSAPSGPYTFAEPIDGGFRAALAGRDVERLEADFDHAQSSQNHRGVDMAHMGDPEGLALQFADSGAEHHAAFFLAIPMQRSRIMTVRHHDRCDGIRPL